MGLYWGRYAYPSSREAGLDTKVLNRVLILRLIAEEKWALSRRERESYRSSLVLQSLSSAIRIHCCVPLAIFIVER